MKLIPLTQGQFAKVDDEDFEKFGGFKWCAKWSECTNSFYAHRETYKSCGGRTTSTLHRSVMGNLPGTLVDHRNSDTLDCQKENLRICSRSQNAMNRKGATAKSKSGIRGVSLYKPNGKWVAHIKINGKNKNLGYFEMKEDAAAAYAAANKKYYGEFGGKL